MNNFRRFKHNLIMICLVAGMSIAMGAKVAQAQCGEAEILTDGTLYSIIHTAPTGSRVYFGGPADAGCAGPGGSNLISWGIAHVNLPPGTVALNVTYGDTFDNETRLELSVNGAVADSTPPPGASDSCDACQNGPDDCLNNPNMSTGTFVITPLVGDCTTLEFNQVDFENETRNAFFFVTSIQDTTAPEITCPGTITVEATEPGGAVVDYNGQVTATDDWDPAPTIECDPVSGSLFPIGNTEVTCTATDDADNSDTCSFFIQVDDTTDPETVILEARDDRGSRGKVLEYGDKTGSTSMKFTFEGTDIQDVTFECSLDGAPFSPCSSQHMFSNLTGGAHVFMVRAIDLSGNTDDTPAIFVWTVAGNKFKKNNN